MAIKFEAEETPAKKSRKPKVVKNQPAKKTRPATTLADLKTKVDKVAKVPRKPREKKEGGKKLTSMRIDEDVIAGFKAGGPGWQGRMNAALRLHLGI